MVIPPPTEKQARVIWLAVTGLAAATLVGLLVALVLGLKWVLQVMGPVLWPLAVAGVVAYLLDPVVDFLERKRVPRSRAIILVFVAAFLAVAAIFGSVVPQIVTETTQLAQKIPSYAQRVEERVRYWISHPPDYLRSFLERSKHGAVTTPESDLATNAVAPAAADSNAATSVTTTNPAPSASTTSAAQEPSSAGALFAQSIDRETLGNATTWIARVAPSVGNWLLGQFGRVASWFGILAGLALIPVYAFYFLAEKRGIESRWTDYLPVANSAFKDELVFVLRSINSYLIAFFRGQVLVAISDGILYTLGFLLIGLPYAVLIGVAAVFLTLIPFLGAIVTCTAALIIALFTFGDVLHPALVLAVFGVVQFLEGFVISPKIMGDRVGLHPLTIIIAVMAGTTILGGILGGLLAIPLTAVLRVVLARYVWKRSLGPVPQETTTAAPAVS